MVKCPDCNSERFQIMGELGDGVCDACHGTGYNDPIDAIASGISGQRGSCYKCDGSGVCSTCNGSGEVDE